MPKYITQGQLDDILKTPRKELKGEQIKTLEQEVLFVMYELVKKLTEDQINNPENKVQFATYKIAKPKPKNETELSEQEYYYKTTIDNELIHQAIIKHLGIGLKNERVKFFLTKLTLKNRLSLGALCSDVIFKDDVDVFGNDYPKLKELYRETKEKLSNEVNHINSSKTQQVATNKVTQTNAFVVEENTAEAQIILQNEDFLSQPSETKNYEPLQIIEISRKPEKDDKIIEISDGENGDDIQKDSDNEKQQELENRIRQMTHTFHLNETFVPQFSNPWNLTRGNQEDYSSAPYLNGTSDYSNDEGNTPYPKKPKRDNLSFWMLPSETLQPTVPQNEISLSTSEQIIQDYKDEVFAVLESRSDFATHSKFSLAIRFNDADTAVQIIEETLLSNTNTEKSGAGSQFGK